MHEAGLLETRKEFGLPPTLDTINRSAPLFRSFLRAETINKTLCSNCMIISTAEFDEFVLCLFYLQQGTQGKHHGYQRTENESFIKSKTW